MEREIQICFDYEHVRLRRYTAGCADVLAKFDNCRILNATGRL